jgi:hypothetical protein
MMRGAQAQETSSTAQHRHGHGLAAGGGFDAAGRIAALASVEWAPLGSLEPDARAHRGGGGGCARCPDSCDWLRVL